AEDGIRDKLVTGVQTCALPISQRSLSAMRSQEPAPAVRAAHGAQRSLGTGGGERSPGAPALTQSVGDHSQISGRGPCLRPLWRRSEERRVGKEVLSAEVAVSIK